MNFELCPLKSRIAPANNPHQSPCTQGEASISNPGGGSSRAPSRNSHTALNVSSGLINYPISNRRKKNIAVFKSMQKKAHPRFTITNVIPQLTALAFPGDNVNILIPPLPSLHLFHPRCTASNTPCHNPHTTKFNPAPFHN